MKSPFLSVKSAFLVVFGYVYPPITSADSLRRWCDPGTRNCCRRAGGKAGGWTPRRAPASQRIVPEAMAGFSAWIMPTNRIFEYIWWNVHPTSSNLICPFYIIWELNHQEWGSLSTQHWFQDVSGVIFFVNVWGRSQGPNWLFLAKLPAGNLT